jgi:hypothetical protein
MGVNAAVNRKNREKATGSSLARFNWIPADAHYCPGYFQMTL